MPLRLALVCHAPTKANRLASFPNDEPLDGPGLQKARAVSLRFTSATRYLRSPALAALQTAEALNIPALIDAELREFDYGRWAGAPIDDIEANDPIGLAKWLSDPAACPHGGETLLAALARVSCWLDEQQGLTGLIVAITHASIVRAAIVHALGAPPLAFWRIDISPMSVTWLNRGKHSWTLASINDSLPRRARR